MVKNEMISDEIIVVGSRYGYFADKLIPLFDEGNPIEVENIKKLFGSDKILLSPDGSNRDPYAVAVYTDSQQRIGFVWMHQSPSVLQWIQDHSKGFIPAHLKRVIAKGGLMVAEPDIPLKLVRKARLCSGLDMNWAADIPETMASLTKQNIGLEMSLLMDELESATAWSDHLRMRIDNLLRDLPHDLSAHNYQKGKLLIETMHRSDIAEVRQHCDEVLASFVYRGSKAQMTWWVEHWLPDFFNALAESYLPGMFETDLYTLDRVEELLRQAPTHLFHIYKENRYEFAYRLYYAALPQTLYNRLLTLLGIREVMLAKKNSQDRQSRDKRLCHVIETLRQEGELIHLYDLTWVMMAMNEDSELPSFDTPSSFIDYLKKNGVKKGIPSRSTISKYYDKARGRLPNWTFIDADGRETIRRNNVGKRSVILLKRE